MQGGGGIATRRTDVLHWESFFSVDTISTSCAKRIGHLHQVDINPKRISKNGRVHLDEILLPTSLDKHPLESRLWTTVSQSILRNAWIAAWVRFDLLHAPSGFECWSCYQLLLGWSVSDTCDLRELCQGNVKTVPQQLELAQLVPLHIAKWPPIRNNQQQQTSPEAQKKDS